MVIAAIASTIGTARGSTHGSWRPLAFSIVGLPSMSIVGLFPQLCGYGFECHTEIDIFAVAYATLYSAAAVCQ